MEYKCPHYLTLLGEGEDDNEYPICTLLPDVKDTICKKGDITTCMYKSDERVLKLVDELHEILEQREKGIESYLEKLSKGRERNLEKLSKRIESYLKKFSR